MGKGRITIGAWGEDQACLFLERQGFSVIDRNYHATVGEIDIVAKFGGDFYFLEVKTRRAGDLAYDTAITPSKIHKLRKTIAHYCSRRGVRGAGLVLAGLMVVYDLETKKVTFRMAVIY